MGGISRIIVAAEIACSVYGNRIIACARKVVIDCHILRSKDVDAIGPPLKAVGFKVIDRDIGGISDINRITAVIGIAVVVHNDPVDRDLVGMVDLNRSIRSVKNDAPPQDFGIRGIIHVDAALNDRPAGDVKRLAARYDVVLRIQARTDINDIRVRRAWRIGVHRIGKKVQCVVTSPFTSAEIFMGPDMLNVIVLPLMAGVILLAAGRMTAVEILPILLVTEIFTGPSVSK